MRKLYLVKPVKTFRVNRCINTLSVETPVKTVQRVRFNLKRPTGTGVQT